MPDEMVPFGRGVVGVEALEHGRGVKLRFADGGEEEASAVVGCGSVKSNLQRILL